MTRLLGLLLVAAPLAAQDGQRYQPTITPFEHVALKAVSAAGVYAILREGFNLSRPASAILATAGVFAIAKGIELAKGHQLGPGDTVHDALWTAALVVPLASRRWTLGIPLAGGILLTRRWSSPRW